MGSHFPSPGDQTQVSHVAGRYFTRRVMREAGSGKDLAEYSVTWPSKVVQWLKKKKKNLPVIVGDVKDVVLAPGSGKSPGGGNGNPIQYSRLRISWK